MRRFKHVYQFKITLKGTKPPVWRRIQVPDTYSFYDLHSAIQDAMGWTDSHLHEFILPNPKTKKEVRIGIPSNEFDNDRTLQGWSNKLSKYFTDDNSKALYVYDFGDNWEHVIVLEGVFPKDESLSYPVCLTGKRACPPEDCGGPRAYEEICEGNHPYQDAYAEYDPNSFNPKEVFFDDPKVRFDLNFELNPEYGV